MLFFYKIKEGFKEIIFSFLKKEWIIIDDINNRELENFRENIFIYPNFLISSNNKISFSKLNIP